MFPGEGYPTTTEADPSQSPIGVADAMIVSQHMLLRQYQEYYAKVTKEYVESKKAKIRGQYEEKLKVAMEEKEQAQKELGAMKSKAEEAIHKVDDLHQELDNEQKQKEVLSTLTSQLQELSNVLKGENAKQKAALDAIVGECHTLDTQLKQCATELEVCKKENASKDGEIARLKDFTPDMHAQEAIDSVNRRLTVVLNALRATGQLLWEPKTVAQALELVQGNITVALMKYAVNIFALDAPACRRIKVYGKETTLDFIVFSSFTQHISVPKWSFLTE